MSCANGAAGVVTAPMIVSWVVPLSPAPGVPNCLETPREISWGMVKREACAVRGWRGEPAVISGMTVAVLRSSLSDALRFANDRSAKPHIVSWSERLVNRSSGASTIVAIGLPAGAAK